MGRIKKDYPRLIKLEYKRIKKNTKFKESVC